jgi:hypothetical protein
MHLHPKSMLVFSTSHFHPIVTDFVKRCSALNAHYCLLEAISPAISTRYITFHYYRYLRLLSLIRVRPTTSTFQSTRLLRLAPSPTALPTHRQDLHLDVILQLDILKTLSLLYKKVNFLDALIVVCLSRRSDLGISPQRPAKHCLLELGSMSSAVCTLLTALLQRTHLRTMSVCMSTKQLTGSSTYTCNRITGCTHNLRSFY